MARGYTPQLVLASAVLAASESVFFVVVANPLRVSTYSLAIRGIGLPANGGTLSHEATKWYNNPLTKIHSWPRAKRHRACVGCIWTVLANNSKGNTTEPRFRYTPYCHWFNENPNFDLDGEESLSTFTAGKRSRHRWFVYVPVIKTSEFTSSTYAGRRQWGGRHPAIFYCGWILVAMMTSLLSMRWGSPRWLLSGEEILSTLTSWAEEHRQMAWRAETWRAVWPGAVVHSRSTIDRINQH